MEIPQQIGCFLSVIMERAAVPPGQPGRNGRAWVRRTGGERLVDGTA